MAATQEILQDVVIKFAGDSGDGMQLTGSQFTNNTALLGIDLATFPDFPAEIRAPVGTLPGVSGYQLHFSSDKIFTPGDECDVLVAMNAAALKVNLRTLKKGGKVIANTDGFDTKNLRLANYPDGQNPMEDGSLAGYELIKIDVTKLTRESLKDFTLGTKEKDRAKNMFVLGFLYWMYNRDMENTIGFLRDKFGKKPDILESNIKVLQAGYNYGETTETFSTTYKVEKAKMETGSYRSIMGNQSLAYGLIAASVKSNLPLFLGSYPITPASDILHELSRHKDFGVKTFQAEDEIAGIASAIGAAFTGSLALTTTSGPGLSLKIEAMGLAVITELPLCIVDVQRGGPSTGLPTKTEQADLLQALYGRHGEAPLVVLSASSPADCFFMSVEAARIAVKYMTPVILLTDGYLAFGSEPLKIPELKELPEIPVKFRTEAEGFHPYLRDENLARPWAIPGTPGLEHRIGGLEKKDVYGNISYEPENHEIMVHKRKQKIENVKNDIPDLAVEGDESGELLVLGWGSTYGAIKEAVRHIKTKGYNASQAHLKYLNPLPKNLGDVLGKFNKVIIPELNLGQMASVIRSTYLREVIQFNKVQGQPFKVIEIENKLIEVLGGKNGK